MTFHDWLLLLSCVSRFIRAVAGVSASFLFIVEKQSTVRTYHILFIYSSTGRYYIVSSFWLLGITNFQVHVFLWTNVFISLGRAPKSGTAGSYGGEEL